MIRILKVLPGSLRDFLRDGGFMLAASLAYFGIMAMVPLSILIIQLTGWLLGTYAGFYRFFASKLILMFPAGAGKTASLIQALLASNRAGHLSLFFYIFLSYGLFLDIEASMNVIFKTGRKRHFFLSVLFSFFMITLTGVLTLFAFAFSTMEPVLHSFGHTLGLGRGYTVLLRYIVPFSLILTVSTSIYVILPARKVRFVNALKGGIFTALMMELAKIAFSVYLERIIPRIGIIYGPLSAFVVLLLWIFYSSCIFLLGGEVVHGLESKRSLR
ncbi:MAG: YihY/virulence factor BrkB family protein [Nitrospiraceae bacterium]|nr:YihY/virulence factor BrkB family protein [Nitrospiraceae bacterium]